MRPCVQRRAVLPVTAALRVWVCHAAVKCHTAARLTRRRALKRANKGAAGSKR